MGSAADHYEILLAEHYSWMFGDFEARVAHEKALLESLGITEGDGWNLRVGGYAKPRLDGGQVADMLRDAGFELLNTEKGLVTIQAVKY